MCWPGSFRRARPVARSVPAAGRADQAHRHVGLEDAGELVALATTEQIAVSSTRTSGRDARRGRGLRREALRDVALRSSSRPGAGQQAPARVSLDPDTVTLAFHQLVHVVVTGVSWRATRSLDDIERALAGALSHELGEYMVIARLTRVGRNRRRRSSPRRGSPSLITCDRLFERLAALTDAPSWTGRLVRRSARRESLTDGVTQAIATSAARRMGSSRRRTRCVPSSRARAR